MNGQCDILDIIEQHEFKFGKYKGRMVDDIIKTDYKYCEWLLNQPDFKKKNTKLFNHMISKNVKYIENYNEIKKKEYDDYKNKYFSFGKYKGKEIEEVFKNDRSYCEYIITLENVRKYHKQTVETIEKLIL